METPFARMPRGKTSLIMIHETGPQEKPKQME